MSSAFKHLSDKQKESLIYWLLDRELVFDLGCEEHLFARFLSKYNLNTKVVGIDKESYSIPSDINIPYIFCHTSFMNANESVKKLNLPKITNAMIAYPVNYEISYGDLFETIEDFVYIGRNNNYTVCGGSTFWKNVIKNYYPVEYVPTKFSNMLIYKKDINSHIGREIFYEEFCGLMNTVITEIMAISLTEEKHTIKEWISVLGL